MAEQIKFPNDSRTFREVKPNEFFHERDIYEMVYTINCPCGNTLAWVDESVRECACGRAYVMDIRLLVSVEEPA